MIRLLLLLLVTLSACAGNKPLRVDCERRMVPINEPIEQIDESQTEPQPEDAERRP